MTAQNAEYELPQFEDDMPLERQTELLAEFLIDRFGGPWGPWGAIEFAVHLLDTHPLGRTHIDGPGGDDAQS